MLKKLYLNDIDTSTMGIWATSDTYLSAPSIDFVPYTVPAVFGDQIQYNRRFNNIIRRIDCLIKEDAQDNMDALKKLIYSSPRYIKIATDYEPGTYQMGYLAQEIEAVPFRKDDALTVQFSLYFSCKPQKFFNTLGTGNIDPEPNPDVVIKNLRGVVTAKDALCAEILNMIPEGDWPEDEYFLMFTLSDLDIHGVSAGFDVTATNSDGFVAIGCFTSDEDAPSWDNLDPIRRAVYYSAEGSASGSFTYQYTSDMIGILVLVPFSPTAVIAASSTNVTRTISADLNDFSVSISNENAVGMTADVVTLDVRLPYLNNQGAVENAYFITGLTGGVRQFLTKITIPLNKLTEAERNSLDKYKEGFRDPGYEPVNWIDYARVSMDAEMNALASKFPFGKYVEVDGDLFGLCDEVYITLVKFPSTATQYVGQALAFDAKIRWWKV